jgi:FixJ family two-component response regulator
LSRNGARTLLCVDDEEAILSSLRRVFLDEDIRVLCATSGAEGLEILKREPVAVILSDQRMPGMTGSEFLREARRIRPETVRIILSGFAEISTVVGAINDGEINKFLAKPWDDTALLETVRTCFAQYDLVIANRELSEQIRAQNEQLKRFNSDLELRNRALQVYQEVLEELPVGVLGISTDGTVALVNACGRDLLGAPAELTLGAHFRDLLPPEATDAVARALEDGATRQLGLSGGKGVRWHRPLRAVVQPLRLAAYGRGVLLVLCAFGEEVNS